MIRIEHFNAINGSSCIRHYILTFKQNQFILLSLFTMKARVFHSAAQNNKKQYSMMFIDYFIVNWHGDNESVV